MAYISATLQANPSAIMSHGTIVGPALAECMKDGNTPVRLAAERCALHAFQLTKGTFTVSPAFCYMLFIFLLIFLLGKADCDYVLNIYLSLTIE